MNRALSIAFVALLLLTGFSGCGTPLVKPQNTEQSIALAYPAHATATKTVTELLQSKRITVDQAENALKISKEIKVGLDLSQNLIRIGKPKDAEAQFKMASKSLEALKDFVGIYQEKK